MRTKLWILLPLCLGRVAGVVAAPAQAAPPPAVTPPTVTITPRNFISLDYSDVGGPSASGVEVSLHPDGRLEINDLRSYVTRVDPSAPKPPQRDFKSKLTATQLKQFFTLVNAASFPHLEPININPHVLDGWDRTIILTYTDRHKHRTALRVDYHNAPMPAGFSALVAYLDGVTDAVLPKVKDGELQQ